MSSTDDARSTLTVGGQSYQIFRLDSLQSRFDVARLPYTLRILLENVLRTAGEEDVEAVATWAAGDEPSREISFTPGRVLLQDFTGVPCVVDLAAMRDAMREQGGDPRRINPLLPVELVIDHSVQVDEFASRFAFAHNTQLELERNRERRHPHDDVDAGGERCRDELGKGPPEPSPALLLRPRVDLLRLRRAAPGTALRHCSRRESSCSQKRKNPSWSRPTWWM